MSWLCVLTLESCSLGNYWLRYSITKYRCDQYIPIPKWGSPNQNGDAHKNESPNQFGDPQTEMGINTSPYLNGDPRIGLGIIQSLTQTGLGIIPIWGATELVPKLERHSKRGPHIGTGIPKPVWVGICAHSKSGTSPYRFGVHSNLGSSIYIIRAS